MFLREVLARTTMDRMAWFWMLLEPIAYIVIMVSIRTVILSRSKHIVGAEFVPWLVLGLFGFFLMRESMMRPIGAIDANRALYAYRQVKPVDPVIIRCYLEGMIRTFVFLLLIIAGILLGIDLFPDEPLRALFYWSSLWLLGVGAGLVLSALSGLVPEVGRIVKIISMPLMLVSGVIFPLNFLPHTLLEYLMWNPIVHGIEALRSSFFYEYKEVAGVSIVYLWNWILALITTGLLLHIRFEARLKRK
ncbi:MAG: ABC transporter permease [Paraglaciecola chathamensis]